MELLDINLIPTENIVDIIPWLKPLNTVLSKHAGEVSMNCILQNVQNTGCEAAD
jgi:hypothetical protein